MAGERRFDVDQGADRCDLESTEGRTRERRLQVDFGEAELAAAGASLFDEEARGRQRRTEAGNQLSAEDWGGQG